MVTPFFFGPPEARLFGIWHLPRQRCANSAVVLCYPAGQEYIWCHRAVAQLAVLLAQSGFDVLRFDYYGTGDSAGDGAEVTLRRRLDDVHLAIGELQARSGATAVSLIGLRLGAALAGLAASERSDIRALGLWDPMVFGRARVADLGAVQRGNITESDAQPDGRRHLPEAEYMLGLPETETFLRVVEEIDLLGAELERAQRVFLITSDERAEYMLLRDALVARGAGLTGRSVDCATDWDRMARLGSALLPRAMLAAIVAEMDPAKPAEACR